MSDQTSSRRHFVKGLGMVTGGLATGAFAINSSANEEGVTYDESPSSLPQCYILISWVEELDIDKSNPTVLYSIKYTAKYICKGKPGDKVGYTEAYPTEQQAYDRMNAIRISKMQGLRNDCGCY